MAFSYSFHISSKGHALSTKEKVNQVGRHNLRKYKTEKYSREKIDVLVGDGPMLDCIAKVYHREFDEALEKYNKGKRADRQIANYLDHVDNSRSDVAVEIIIQIGDMDFWKDVADGDKRKMNEVFRNQIDELERILPNFKVASAVAHYDESSPHLHIVGVPVATGYQKGMEKQCAKTKVFTKESLEMIQDVMHQNAEKNVMEHPEIFGDMELKEKEIGRNKDIPKQALKEYNELKEAVELTTEDLIDKDIALKQTIDHMEKLKREKLELEKDNTNLSKSVENALERIKTLVGQNNTLEDEITALEAKKDALEVDEQVLVAKFLDEPQVKSLFDRFKELWQAEVERKREKREERQDARQENRERTLGTLEYYEQRIEERKRQGGSGMFGERQNTKSDKKHEDR